MDKDMEVLIKHALINQLGVSTEQDQGPETVERQRDREREMAEREENKKLNDRGSIKESKT